MSAFGPYPGICDRVIDGDTIYCRLDVGFDLTVYARCRILGINAPEMNTTQGKAARQYVLDHLVVPGGACVVTSYGWDKYGGRIDASVVLPDGRNFAQEMLAAGQAVPYP